jgi:tetratricopeptide (TPR) repeat protein
MNTSALLPALLLCASALACAAPQAQRESSERNNPAALANAPARQASAAPAGSMLASSARGPHLAADLAELDELADASSSAPAEASAESTAHRPDVDVELAVWNSPSFRKRFAESFLSELDIEPRVTEAERGMLEKVIALLGDDKLGDARYAQAQKLLEKGRNPASSALVDFMLANLHFQAERWDAAAADYLIAIEKHPKFRRAWGNLGLIYVRQGEHAEAARALTKVIELGGHEAQNYGLLGYSLSNLENHLAAETAYRTANLLDPQTQDWRMGLARSLFKQRRFTDAIAFCAQMIDAEPERADLWLLQANAYIGSEQPLRAAENYEIVERLGASTPESLNTLGDIYLNEGLFELAVERYVGALALDGRAPAERPLRAAKALVQRGELGHSEQLLAGIEQHRGAVLNEGERKDVLKLRARLAVAAGAGGEEARILEQIVALDPLDGEALILLGQHSNRSGDPEQAIFYFERAAQLEAFEADAKVRHAQLLVGQGKYALALPLLRRAQDLQPRENIQQYLEQVERVAGAR